VNTKKTQPIIKGHTPYGLIKVTKLIKQKHILVKMGKKKREFVLVLGAHSDDFVIGAGGTIAEYSREGKRVLCVVFSYGELSHPWMKKEEVVKIREEEAHKAGKVLGCRVKYFGLKDQGVYEDYKNKGIENKLLELIKKNKPTKVFTHSIEDPHPDHRAVHKITKEIYAQISGKKPELYVYSIWNPVSIKTSWPKMYVDITKSFSKKLKALKEYPSQRFQAIYPLMVFVFWRAFKNGLKIRKRMAETFYRVK
jgi:N-acetylglucosamine malate deacetylase 1